MNAWQLGRLMGFGLVAAIVGIGHISTSIARSGMDPVTATVTTVERSCRFVSESGKTTKTDYCGDSASLTGDPKLFANGKRIASVNGSADVVFLYTAPDGSSQSGRTTVPADEDLFYTVKSGDPLPIHVDRNSPSTFILD